MRVIFSIEKKSYEIWISKISYVLLLKVSFQSILYNHDIK